MGDFQTFGFEDFPANWSLGGGQKQIKKPKNLRLTIEFVPLASPVWQTDIESCVSARDWRRLCATQGGCAGGLCEVCRKGGREQGFSRGIEFHERWEYDEEHEIQTLKRLLVLCPLCHRVKHWNTLKNRDAENVLHHLMEVNQLESVEVAKHYLQEAYALYQQRSQIKWLLDLSWLENQGIQILPRRRYHAL